MRANLGIALALSVVFELRLVDFGANLAIGRDSRIIGITIGRNISYRELIDTVAMDLLVGFAIDLLLEVRVKEDTRLALLYRREGVLYRPVRWALPSVASPPTLTLDWISLSFCLKVSLRMI